MSDYDDAIRNVFTGSGVLLVGLVLQLGISFFGKLVVARNLSVADFGSVSLGMTVASLTALFALAGLHTGLARFLPRFDDEPDRKGVLVSAFSIAVPLAALGGVVIVVGAPLIATEVFDSPGIAPVLRIFGLVVPLTVLFRLTISTIRGQQRSAPKVLIESVLRPFARIGAILVVVWVGISSTRIAVAYLIGWLVPTAVGVLYVARTTSLFSLRTTATYRHRELLVFSLPLLASAAFSYVINDIDTILLGYFSGSPEPVGIYGVIYPIATILNSALSAFGFVFMPIISEMHSNGRMDDLRRTYHVATKWMFISILPVTLVMILLPERLISMTFGAKYASGGLALSVLAVGFLVHTTVGLNRQIVVSLGKTRFDMYVNLSGAAVNVVLNVLLIPRYGVLGAAIATAATFLLTNAVVSTYLYLTLDVLPFTLSLLRPGVAGVLSFLSVYAVIRLFLRPTLWVLVVGFAVFVATYVVSFLRFGGIEEEEVMIVRSFEEKYGTSLEPLKRIARRFM